MAQSQPSAAREQVRNIVPGLIDLSERVLFGEVWERPGLSKRDRSLITCATLIALGREKQLVGHLQRALDNGLSKNELSEVITHLAFYAGWPAAMTAALVAKEVFEKMIASGSTAADIVTAEGLTQIDDESQIVTLIEEVLSRNREAVAQYRSGKTATFGFLVGQVMKAASGKANPQRVNDLLRKALA